MSVLTGGVGGSLCEVSACLIPYIMMHWMVMVMGQYLMLIDKAIAITISWKSLVMVDTQHMFTKARSELLPTSAALFILLVAVI